jgi:DNA-directed RNA polymerase II subunit RPB1
MNPTLSTDLEAAIQLKRSIQRTTIRDITKTVRIYYDPLPLSPESAVDEDREMLSSFAAFSVGKPECVSPWVMRLEFDRTEMAARNITDMAPIQTALLGNLAIKISQCVFSDINAKKLLCRIVFEDSFAKNLLVLRYVEDKILEMSISGVDGIGRVYHREINREMLWDPAVGGYVSKKQHVLDVEGVNLFNLLDVPNVDATRTFSNDIHEVLEVFGIEAARQALYDELNEVFTGAGATLNYHHLAVLLDTITYQGRLVPVNRFGMSKHDNGVLAKSSFEETSKILFNAATAGSFDPMVGVSANIMFGQKPPCGTGLVEILLDETRMPEGVAEDEYTLQQTDLKTANARIAAAPAESGDCRLEDILMEW